jgi:hypothetical protein
MPKVTINHDAPSAAALKEAKKPVYVTDSKGRKLTLRKLPFLEEFRILEAVGPELSGNTVYMNMLNFLLLVGEIDGVTVEIPRSKREVEALIQRAGREAFQAITDALTDEKDNDVKRFFSADKDLETKIKNAEGTPA